MRINPGAKSGRDCATGGFGLGRAAACFAQVGKDFTDALVILVDGTKEGTASHTVFTCVAGSDALARSWAKRNVVMGLRVTGGGEHLLVSAIISVDGGTFTAKAIRASEHFVHIVSCGISGEIDGL